MLRGMMTRPPTRPCPMMLSPEERLLQPGAVRKAAALVVQGASQALGPVSMTQDRPVTVGRRAEGAALAAPMAEAVRGAANQWIRELRPSFRRAFDV
jgi:hypothetical protein